MGIKRRIHDLKVWWRAGSWQFVKDDYTPPRRDVLHVLRWKGIPLFYRPGTTDRGCIYEILLRPQHKVEYRLPAGLNPKVILDIGGNIGMAAVYFASCFPQAKIYTFEPVPDNFAILSRNVAALPNVTALPMALGASGGWFDVYASTDDKNLGGFSLYTLESDGVNAGTDESQRLRVEVKRPSEALAQLGIDHVDLIKIDTEGSEYDILTAMDPAILSRVSWIMGELHGNRDFELLAYLAPWFDLQVDKSMDRHLFLFNARNKALRGHVGTVA